MSSTSDSWSHWLQNQSLVRFNSGTAEQEQVAYSNTVVTPWVGQDWKFISNVVPR
ncbi:hypothetical protein AB9M62_39185 [Bacillales bacterium AN1005]